MWAGHENGAYAMEDAIALIRKRVKKQPQSALADVIAQFSRNVGGDSYAVMSELLWAIGDFYFLPKKDERFFYELATVFFEAKLFHEIAIPTIAAGLGMDWKTQIANKNIRQALKWVNFCLYVCYIQKLLLVARGSAFSKFAILVTSRNTSSCGMLIGIVGHRFSHQICCTYIP